jgi:hypothetical protein
VLPLTKLAIQDRIKTVLSDGKAREQAELYNAVCLGLTSSWDDFREALAEMLRNRTAQEIVVDKAVTAYPLDRTQQPYVPQVELSGFHGLQNRLQRCG